MTNRVPPDLTLGAKATLACLWEATAPKPGNVYRGADFGDLTYADFLASAAAVGPVFDNAPSLPVGELVHAAVQQTRRVVATNTNLGTLLLLAPLAKSAPSPRERVSRVIEAASVDDAARVYEAIRLASPGGMGQVDSADIAGEPTVTLLETMRLAEDRDLIARQYTHAFSDVFEAADAISKRVESGLPLADAIVWEHLELMARRPDTLIARKCGPDVARQAADRAGETLTSARMDGGLRAACAELDFWLRADGHRRNPGATADAIAAALFVLLIEDRIAWPLDYYGRRSGATG